MSNFLPPLDWRTMSLEDMVEAICSGRAWREGDEDDQTQLFDMARAVFWWTGEHGQDMDEVYAAHCRVGEHYYPGVNERGIEEGTEQVAIYAGLCEMAGGRCSCASDKIDSLKSDDPLED